jgi:dienelactone hydrolase
MGVVASAGSAAISGASGASGTSGTGDANGCGSNLLPAPDDVSQRGPWDVGVKTVTIPRTGGGTDMLITEVLYPAQPGSSAGKPEVTYDPRKWLPVADQMKVPDSAAPPVGPIGGHLYRDVPLDTAHGPYPLVVFIHGTASFRVASISLNAHWASRGFIVVAADYPGFALEDELNEACNKGKRTQNIMADVQAQIAAVSAASGDLAFLAGHADLKRLGISGHSQGGCNAAVLSSLPNVQIVLPLSGSTTVTASPALKSLIFVAGIGDTVIGYDTSKIGNIVCPAPSSSDKQAYMESPTTAIKRLVGISGGGHLVPTELCRKNSSGKDAVAESQADGVCGISNAAFIGLPALDDCGTIDWMKGVAAVIYPTTAALEETLLCKDRTQAFADMKKNVPDIGDFQETKPTK